MALLRCLLSVSAGSAADITVGFVTSLSGPGASIGIPYEKGVLAGHGYAAKVGDVNIKLIRLDDASDPPRRRAMRASSSRRKRSTC